MLASKLLWPGFLSLLIMPVAHGEDAVSAIKADEEVIFFPTAARLAENGTEWLVPIHGWIFEPETGDLLRGRAVRELTSGLELDRTGPRGKLFEQRIRWFLTDNERGKQVVIRVGSRLVSLEPSTSNGQFFGSLRVPRAEAEQIKKSGALYFLAAMPKGDDREFSGTAMLVEPRGLSVISDLDDTIKITEVRDKRQLVENTFFQPFRAVDGMAAGYQSWAKAGATFHYLSNGPWQMYPPLASFLRDDGFPAGTVQLRNFRLQDGAVVDFLLTDPMQAKLSRIERVLADFPERQFVLVGDSGEKDPETYAEIARRHPKQTVSILIRDVTKESRTAKRYVDAFRNVPPEKWLLFTDPKTLPPLSERN